MATIVSPFVGRAKGQLGGGVFYHTTGGAGLRQKTIAVKNPQSDAQMQSRILLSTLARVWFVVKSICDHSFQGASGAEENYKEWYNFAYRDLLRWLTNAPQPMDYEGFNPKGLDVMLLHTYQIAKGSLSEVSGVGLSRDTGGYNMAGFFLRTDSRQGTISYQNVLDRQGYNEGTQLTFLYFLGDRAKGEIYTMKVARIILRPATGNSSQPFISSQNELFNPNPANEGVEQLGFYPNTEQAGIGYGVLVYYKPEMLEGMEVVAVAAIASAKKGRGWQRSNATMKTYGSGYGSMPTYGEALASYKDDNISSQYLNQSQNPSE